MINNHPLNYFEKDIEKIRQKLEEKKEKLNLNFEKQAINQKEEDKKIIKDVIIETYPVKKSLSKKIIGNLRYFFPIYLKKDENINEEIKKIVEDLINLAINEGIEKAIKKSLKYSSFIQDAFHDALIDKIIPFLKEKNKIKI